MFELEEIKERCIDVVMFLFAFALGVLSIIIPSYIFVRIIFYIFNVK